MCTKRAPIQTTIFIPCKRYQLNSSKYPAMSCTITLQKSFSFPQNNRHFVVSCTLKRGVKEEEEKLKKVEEKSCKVDCKHELISYDALPEFLKDNEFVLNYYRSEWPLKQTILSIFSIHNETLNIWTHLIGFLIFLMIAVTMISSSMDANPHTRSTDLSSMNSTSSASMKIQHDQLLLVLPSVQSNPTYETVQWPFYAYIAGAMLCLIISSSCHLLSCHSKQTCYVMLRLDYTGISALIVTSFYPLVYYTFMCHPFIRNLYMSFITVFGISTISVSLMPVFQKPEYRFVRAGLFACMGVSGVVPIMHKMYAFGDREEALVTTMYEILMLCFYGVGVVVYTLRIPERWMPGVFDLVGHSHQLWHLLVIAGAYTHYLAALVYLTWRQTEGC